MANGFEYNVKEEMYRGLASADMMAALAGASMLSRGETASQNQPMNLTGGGLVCEVDRQLPPARYRPVLAPTRGRNGAVDDGLGNVLVRHYHSLRLRLVWCELCAVSKHRGTEKHGVGAPNHLSVLLCASVFLMNRFAAKFLEPFIGNARWIHLDIAGPAFAESAKPFRDAGATGVMVRTLVRWLSHRSGHSR